MEDDWKFVIKRNYITECLDVLTSYENVGQCLLNKNYAEKNTDIRIIGGNPEQTEGGTKIYIHEHCKNDDDYKKFYEKHGHGSNCAYWKHFSFRPSIHKKQVWIELGDFDEKVSHFEAAYSEKYLDKGYVSAFLDGIFCLHTGRLTSEINDTSKPNAYILNGEKQFSGKEDQTNNFQTYVINLNKRVDRWKKFTELDAPKFLNYQRFSAVDGKKLVPNIQLQRIFEGNDYNMRPGMVGCAMSHIKLYIELLNSSCDKFLILEDDITFVKDFKDKFNHLLTILPTDLDLCYLGHHMWPEKVTDEYDQEKNPIIEKWDVYKSFTQSIGGTGGYIITKKGAKNLLDFINTTGMTNGIDTVQQKSANKLNIYYCRPHLIYSDCWTNNKNTDTDIQNDFETLNYPGNVSTEYPERLKKNDVFNIEDALKFKEKPKVISISGTTHVSEAIDTLNKKGELFPFDKIDGGEFENFVQIICDCLDCKETELIDFVEKFLENKYAISFPHEKMEMTEMKKSYIEKFIRFKSVIQSEEKVLLVHVARWKQINKEDAKKLIEHVNKYNKNVQLLCIQNYENTEIQENISYRKLSFPERFHTDSWDDYDKIMYDQNVYRVDLISVISNFFENF